jgi:hypothetical protein
MNLPGLPAAAASGLLAGLALTALASCGGESSTSTPGPATASSALPGCRTNDLRISRGPGNGAAGHLVLGFQIRNPAGPRCTLLGFPAVALLSAPGRPLSTKVKPRASDFFGHLRRRLVVVPRRGLASFRLAVSDAINGGNCPSASRMRVTLPGDSEPRLLAVDVLACPGGVTVSPVAPGRSAYSGG